MSKQSVLTGYLAHYAQAHTLPEALKQQWQNVVIVPICGEADDCLAQLVEAVESEPFLIIVCLNRPQNNDETHHWQARNKQLLTHLFKTANHVSKIGKQADGYLCEFDGYAVWVLDYNELPFDDNLGVGLARKIAADSALKLISQGCIKNPWIHSTDADAKLPINYFEAAAINTDCVAYSLVFEHITDNDDLSYWQSLYDFKLYYYQRAMRYIGTDYDYIPLGSSLIIDADAYAKVRGFPRKSGGEDFYILNKLAKIGVIAQPNKPIIKIRSRLSSRVPFGTGPAMTKLAHESQLPMFYHPTVFLELKKWRQSLLSYYQTSQLPINDRLNSFWKITTVLNQAKTQTNTLRRWRQFIHEWFDAFKVLKSVHCLELQHPRLPLLELNEMDLFKELVMDLEVPE